MDRRARGVPQRVGDALLHHAIAEMRGGRRELVAALDLQRDLQPARARLLHELLGQLEAGSLAPVGLAEQRHEPPEIPLGAARGGRDRVERLAGERGVALDQPLPGARLHDHDAERVGDDVVQLGGDPRPLVASRELRVRLALRLELARPLGQALGDRLALAQRAADPQPTATNMTAGMGESSWNTAAPSSSAPSSAADSSRPVRSPETRPRKNAWPATRA